MLPEVISLNQASGLIRIPPSDGVPLSRRVRRIIDSAAMRRLASISQLGMVSLVYPGAMHSRFEHSLGVYHNALRLLARLDSDTAFQNLVDETMCEAFVLAALVHDVGHWPFCHPIEDMRLDGLEEHESRVGQWLRKPEIADCIDQDWNATIDDVLELLQPISKSPAVTFLASCLSGPIDVDKLDYLQRDSLHAGVPYGNNFDTNRLIASICVHPEKGQLAVGEKGRTAAEMMVFARYVMFSEVYWHHTVRSATAMLQRAVFLLQNRFDLQSSLRLVDAEWIAMLTRAAEGSVAEPLANGLFGSRRQLYKRVAEFSAIPSEADSEQGLQTTAIHRQLARRPYWWLVVCAESLASHLSQQCGVPVHAADVLIDAPPSKLEVDINVDVVMRDGRSSTLGDVSPVASALANQQFDNQVKRVRVFVRREVRDQLRQQMGDRGSSTRQWAQWLASAIEITEQGMA
ncbi:HD domain-containing protein [Planctomycetes bacterium K23_9]|uniref:Deoxyguanosinetriphosphate triphosphohydrolase-like protein n=1 Tax=Stieleria marina TaxID=1930275 RepID=A0A517NUV5_9BACT|nr:deoxyguanosinetriphosphate triphosphohydrolase-like protein [Planctomycetes bacterium K23_9]